MNKFGVNVPHMSNSAEELVQYAELLKKLKDEMSKTRNFDDNRALKKVKGKILQIEDVLLEESEKVNSLSKTLNIIIKYYAETEKRIMQETVDEHIVLNSVVDSSEEGNQTTQVIENKKSFLDSFLETMGLKVVKPERIDGEEVKAEQEEQMDKYIKQELKELSKEDRYSYFSWNFASLEEKKEILEEYKNDVAIIMGMDPNLITLDFFSEEEKDGLTRWGWYDGNNNKIGINESELKKETWFYCFLPQYLNTINHEMRHAYQNEVMKNPDGFMVTEDTIKTWVDNTDTPDDKTKYKNTEEFIKDGMTKDEAHEAYKKQATEVDAREFEVN